MGHGVLLHVIEGAVIRDGVQRLGRQVLAQELADLLDIASQILKGRAIRSKICYLSGKMPCANKWIAHAFWFFLCSVSCERVSDALVTS